MVKRTVDIVARWILILALITMIGEEKIVATTFRQCMWAAEEPLHEFEIETDDNTNGLSFLNNSL